MSNIKDTPPAPESTEETPVLEEETPPVVEEAPVEEEETSVVAEEIPAVVEETQESPPETDEEQKTDSPPPEDKDNRVQILIKVPPEIKNKAQHEAELAYQYGWIPNNSLTQLIIWTIDIYLAEGIKQYIMKRRESEAAPVENKDE